MNEILKLGLMLLLITTIAALVLGLTHTITFEKILEAEAKVSEIARKEVLSADSFEKEDEYNEGNILEVFSGVKDGNIIGYAIKSFSPNGYGGNIEVITGIDINGKITGIKVVKHAETPGLGANAENESFSNQFVGKSGNLKVNKDIEALTGATITSKAVTEAVNYAVDLFNTKLNK